MSKPQLADSHVFNVTQKRTQLSPAAPHPEHDTKEAA